ncbi:hypothetical protein Tco_1150419 [Tanacetum coccineum]
MADSLPKPYPDRIIFGTGSLFATGAVAGQLFTSQKDFTTPQVAHGFGPMARAALGGAALIALFHGMVITLMVCDNVHNN